MRGSLMGQGVASDDDLMCAAAGGDEEAFAELVRRHRSWVRALLLAVVRNPDPAEDLTQEAFCRVYRNLEEYEPQGRFVAWLKRIALNQAKDFLRRERKAAAMPLGELEETLVTDSRFDPIRTLA